MRVRHLGIAVGGIADQTSPFRVSLSAGILQRLWYYE